MSHENIVVELLMLFYVVIVVVFLFRCGCLLQMIGETRFEKKKKAADSECLPEYNVTNCMNDII